MVQGVSVAKLNCLSTCWSLWPPWLSQTHRDNMWVFKLSFIKTWRPNNQWLCDFVVMGTMRRTPVGKKQAGSVKTHQMIAVNQQRKECNWLMPRKNTLIKISCFKPVFWSLVLIHLTQKNAGVCSQCKKEDSNACLGVQCVCAHMFHLTFH